MIEPWPPPIHLRHLPDKETAHWVPDGRRVAICGTGLGLHHASWSTDPSDGMRVCLRCQRLVSAWRQS